MLEHDTTGEKSPDETAELKASQPNWHQLRGIQRDLLVTIFRLETRERDPLDGQTIKRKCETIREEEIPNGQLYSNLDTLVEKELVAKGLLTARSNAYELTDTGHQLITDRAAAFQTLVTKEATA